MTTAFILALIAAVGVLAVLLAAISRIRALEHDNACLMRIIGELNEEQAKLCKELEEQRKDMNKMGAQMDWWAESRY